MFLKSFQSFITEAKIKRNFDYNDDKGRVHKTVSRDMDNYVYSLRRKVMDYIYAAKKLVNGDLPRIEVRIVDISVTDIAKKDSPSERSSILGFGQMGQNQIWISTHTIEEGYNLHEVVFHEILHAAYTVYHNENSPLMGKYHKKTLSDALIDQLFLSHVDCPKEEDWNLKYKQKYSKYINVS